MHIRKLTEMSSVRNRWHEKKGRYPNESDVERMFASFVPAQLAVLHKYTRMIPGAVETVNELQKVRKLKIGSTTGFTTPMVDILKKAATEQGYTPDVYVAADEVPQARPFPFMVMLNAIRMNVSPIAAIVKVQRPRVHEAASSRTARLDFESDADTDTDTVIALSRMFRSMTHRTACWRASRPGAGRSASLARATTVRRANCSSAGNSKDASFKPQSAHSHSLFCCFRVQWA